MNTKILEYFIAAAEEQNISRAAERCYISQPALSQHIQQLEKQLGVPLFTRTGRHVELTDYGKVYLNNAHAILRVEQQTLEKISALRDAKQSCLRIISTERTKSILNNSILPQLREQYPHTAVSLLTGTSDIALSYLLQDMADAGIFDITASLPPELDSTVLIHQEYAIAVPPDHPLASRPSVSLDECQDEPFILGSPQSELGDSQQQVLNSFRFVPQVLYHVDKIRTVAHMVSNSAGISLLPAGLLEESQFNYRSVPLNPPWKFETVFAYPRSAPLSSCGQELLRLLQDFYGRPAPNNNHLRTEEDMNYEKKL